MTKISDCPLCRHTSDDVLWQNNQLRVISVTDADYPGLTRVIWNDHVKEMTDLSPKQRTDLMTAVWQVERAQRCHLKPDKINLAQFGNMTPHLHWHVIARWQADSRFPEAIWAPAPARTPEQIAAWQKQSALLTRQVAAYHDALITTLAA
ncbi:MAG: HIT family protein [Candidimonas sp.]|nr:MAG: HIT family protein [Candidimonas sp.]TAM22490.1 MAG: HIT family protein [Candidimonas sp.]TAM77976.1 MAG: HIT family protein [Candidimonas sp.]